MITKREAAIISAYTGYLLGDFEDVNQYAIELFGEERWDKKIPDNALMDELQERAKKDFEALEVKDEIEFPPYYPDYLDQEDIEMLNM